jgi:HK97 family phage prohead protease
VEIVLSTPQRIDTSFSISSVVEKGLTQNDAATGNEQWIEVEGYASRMYNADGDYVIDSHQENVNTWGVDLTRLKNGILPILYNHDQDKVVGSVLEATYDRFGLLIKAKIVKLPGDNLTNYVYHAVKSGIIKAFSVGIIVKGFDVVEQDDEEYLQLTKSECIEVSLVAVPANHEALFRMTNLKSVDGVHKSVMMISKSNLKRENATACDGFSCAIKAQMEEKNMQVEEKEVVLGVTDEALEQLEEINNPPEPEEQSSVEDTEPIEGTTVTSGEVEQVKDPNDKPSEEPQQDLPPELKPEPVAEQTAIDQVNSLVGLDISKLSDTELEQVYEVLSTIVEQIEGKVVAEVVQELTTVTAPQQ